MSAAFLALVCIILFIAGIGRFIPLFISAALHIIAISIAAGAVGSIIPVKGKLAPAICGAVIAILCSLVIIAIALAQI